MSYDAETANFTLNNPAREGYKFDGWRLAESTEKNPSVTIAKGSAGNKKYTAIFTPIDYAITYDLNGGTNNSANPATYNIETPTITLKNPERAGYTFNRWTLDGETVTEIPLGSMGEKTFKANYTPITYTIDYVFPKGTNNTSNPGTYTIESSTIVFQNPELDGYTFDGWTGEDVYSPSLRLEITQGSISNRTYTANFTPIVYDITYDLDEGTNADGNPATYTIETDTITLKEPTREGYDFMGWTLDGEDVTEIPLGSLGTKTLKATWRETAPATSQDIYTITVFKGQEVSLTIKASGVNLDWNMDGTLPEGLDFSASENSAAITGTPASGTTGTYDVAVTAENEGGSITVNIALNVEELAPDSIDVEVGEPSTTATENGGSTTSAQTTFKGVDGEAILVTDIAITVESEDFTVLAGTEFSTTVNVDVKLNLSDADYKDYAYTMELEGLPEWLTADGELSTTETLEAGEAEKHHVFTLSGTPSGASSHVTTFTAKVSVSGLESLLGKEVRFSVVEPEQDTESEDVRAVLESLNVEITGSDALAVEAGNADSMTLAASVNGTYSDGSTKTLGAGEYVLTWENDITAEGISFSDGTLSVSDTTESGIYEVNITVTAASGEVSASSTKTVLVSVLAEASAAPVLACANPSVTLNVGSVLESLTVLADVLPETWIYDGELPDGLSFADNGSVFVISGTVSVAAEARDYVFTVNAENEFGTSAPITITITVTRSTSPSPDTGTDTGSTGTDTGSTGDTGNTGTDTGNDGGSSVVVEAKVTQPSAPAISVQDESVKQAIVSVLQELSSTLSALENVNVVELAENATVTERTELSEEEAAQLSDDEAVAVIMPTMSVTEPAVYVFAVEIDLPVGAKITLRMMAKSAEDTTAAAFFSSENDAEMCTFLDDDGNVIDTVPENKHVNIAAYMEPGKTYSPIITTTVESSSESGESGTTGGNDSGSGDSGNSGGNDSGSDGGSTGGSSGGCESGLGFFALAALITLAARKK